MNRQFHNRQSTHLVAVSLVATIFAAPACSKNKSEGSKERSPAAAKAVAMPVTETALAFDTELSAFRAKVEALNKVTRDEGTLTASLPLAKELGQAHMTYDYKGERVSAWVHCNAAACVGFELGSNEEDDYANGWLMEAEFGDDMYDGMLVIANGLASKADLKSALEADALKKASEKLLTLDARGDVAFDAAITAVGLKAPKREADESSYTWAAASANACTTLEVWSTDDGLLNGSDLYINERPDRFNADGEYARCLAEAFSLRPQH